MIFKWIIVSEGPDAEWVTEVANLPGGVLMRTRSVDEDAADAPVALCFVPNVVVLETSAGVDVKYKWESATGTMKIE